MSEVQSAAHAWDVVIVGFRLNAERPAQVLERVLQMPRTEAQACAKKFPHLALSGVDKRRADSALEALRAAGARAELHPHGSLPKGPSGSFVLTSSGRKSLVVVESIVAANDNPGASASAVAPAGAEAARSEGRVSVYKLGEIEVVANLQPSTALLPYAAAGTQHEAPRAQMQPIAEPALSYALPVPSPPRSAASLDGDSAIADGNAWGIGDFRVIDDTLNDYGHAPMALELDHRAKAAPATRPPRARRISLMERAHAYGTSHGGAGLGSILKQTRRRAGPWFVFVITTLVVFVGLGERAQRRALDDALQSLWRFAEERLATSKAKDEPASVKERIPSARATFMEMRTPGVNRVAVDWPLESGELAHVSCLLLEDPTPSKIEMVRGSRVALAIPKGVESQLRDHAETLRAARGREDMKLEQLCLADE